MATIEDIEAAAHRICHEGDPRPNVFVSHAVNDCPPTAGKAVRVAASVPPRIVMLRSRPLRGSSADINRSTCRRFCRIRLRRSSLALAGFMRVSLTTKGGQKPSPTQEVRRIPNAVAKLAAPLQKMSVSRRRLQWRRKISNDAAKLATTLQN